MNDDEIDQWAKLDDLLGLEALAAGPAATGGSIGAARVLWAVFDGGQPGSEEVARLAVGGGSAVVEPSGGEIVAEYFGIGESRSLPWERRSQASLILAALKDPERGWDGLVVGEATRCRSVRRLGLGSLLQLQTRVADVPIRPTRVWLACVSEERHAP